MHKIKLILIAVFICCGLLNAKAQIGEPRNIFSIGANAGLNINSATFNPTIKQGMLMGPNFGISARYITEKYFAMICGAQIEVNFAQRGWKETFDKVDAGHSYSRTMNYIEVPFLAHLAFGKEEKGLQFFLNLGPQFAYFLSDSEKFSANFNPSKVVKEQYGKKVDNKFDYGIAGGLGIELKTKKSGNFLIEGRYYFGLSDFFSNSKKEYFDRSAHNVISIKLSYFYDIIKN